MTGSITCRITRSFLHIFKVHRYFHPYILGFVSLPLWEISLRVHIDCPYDLLHCVTLFTLLDL